MAYPMGRDFPMVKGYDFISKGGSGSVYKITKKIALKFAVSSNSEEFNTENATYDLLEKHPPCPYVIQAFYRTGDYIFLPLLSCGTLWHRMRRNQKVDGLTVLAVLRIEDRRLIERWTAELCAAVAWLDTLGIVHGDLRPTNILLDDKDHMKLTDFDCVQKVGTPFLGICAPWARIRPESGERGYGVCGPEIVQFAVGSIVYYMTRGFEPYEVPGQSSEDPLKVLDLWEQKIFPPVRENDPLDHIIQECWMGHFPSLNDLLESAKRLPGSKDMVTAGTWSEEYLAAMREECVALVKSGSLQTC
ncbi:kinase-like protein [Nemania sp. FL0031]|nr:kinase-like protein [Nemania sp. FL0031]